jgi:hypothetical protein
MGRRGLRPGLGWPVAIGRSASLIASLRPWPCYGLPPLPPFFFDGRGGRRKRRFGLSDFSDRFDIRVFTCVKR